MSVTFHSFSGWSGQLGQELTAFVPAGTQDGDFLLLLVATESTENHVTPPGWRLVANERNGNAHLQPNISVFARRAANEPESYVAHTSESNFLGHAGMARFSDYSDPEAGNVNSAVQNLYIDGVSHRSSATSSAMISAEGFTVRPSQGLVCVYAVNVTNSYPETILPPDDMDVVTSANYYQIASALFTQEVDEDTYFTYVLKARGSASGSWSTIAFKLGAADPPPMPKDDLDLLVWMR